MASFRVYGVVLAVALFGSSSAAQASCDFDRATLTFAGEPLVQARCLLKPVLIGAAPGPEQQLPAELASRIGRPTSLSAPALRQRLDALDTTYRHRLPGTLANGVSQTSAGLPALYFVIHDTSTPYYRNAPFPANLNQDARVNGIAGFLNADAVARYFVNRLGQIGEGHDFAVPWRATRLETRIVGVSSRGRFLHIELVQPRRRDPGNSDPDNDRFAPEPGFTTRQYDTLALLYAVASQRAGRWLIPAFHANVDRGISGAHDDPQNFSMAEFAAALGRVLDPLEAQPARSGAGAPRVSGAPAGATARWGDANGRRAWTDAAYDAVLTLGTALWREGFLPSDIRDYCPAYGVQNAENRRLFWVGLLSSLARYESDFDPATTYTESFPDGQGRPVVSRGLLQLSIESANGSNYRCGLQNAQQLHDPAINLQCGVRIMNYLVPRGSALSTRQGEDWRGAAAYWGPFRRPDRREGIAAWTRVQPYCRGA